MDTGAIIRLRTKAILAVTLFFLPSRRLVTHHILDADAVSLPLVTGSGASTIEFDLRPMNPTELLQSAVPINSACRVDNGASPRNANRPLAERESTSITLGQRLRPYFGTLHSHTAESDGRGTVDEAYEMAHSTAKLDFFAITDHAEYWLLNKMEKYQQQKARADAWARPDFVTLYGFEYSHPYYGHYTVLNANSVHHAFEDFGIPDFYRWLSQPEQDQALVMFAHPGFHDYRIDSEFDHFALAHSLVDRFVGVETIHWSEYLRYFRGYFGNIPYIDEANKIGWRLGAVGSQDVHYADWGTRDGTRVVALMPKLSRQDLLDALKSRHFYATNNRDLYFAMQLQRNDGSWVVMGDRVSKRDVPISAVKIKTRFYDGDCQEPPRRLEVLLNGQVVGVYNFPPPNGSLYYAAELTATVPLELRRLPSKFNIYVRLFQGSEGYTQSSPVFFD